MLPKRVKFLLQRPYFRKNPVCALFKRLIWRIRWKFKHKPWLLTLSNGMQILVPKSGSGALIYYQGYSEPEVVSFLKRFLKSNMVIIDVGAHIGEYTLLSAKIVGNRGKVYPFEPDPRNYELLKSNVSLNKLTETVYLSNCAISDRVGSIKLALFKESSVSHISVLSRDVNDSLSIIEVPTITLDAFYDEKHIRKVDLIKIDVEGAELLVLEGAQQILSLPREKAPMILFEYSPSNCARLGYDSKKIVKLFESYGYKIYKLTVGGEPSKVESFEVPFGRHCNFLAYKG